MGEELALAAGLFNGEGSTTVGRRWSSNYVLRLHMSQTGDPQILNWMVDILGVGKVYGPYYRKVRPKWEWQVFRGGEAWRAVKLMWPWLSDAKRAQAVKARVDEATRNLHR